MNHLLQIEECYKFEECIRELKTQLSASYRLNNEIKAANRLLELNNQNLANQIELLHAELSSWVSKSSTYDEQLKQLQLDVLNLTKQVSFPDVS
jgi:chromosome segregation ATPase